MSKINLLVPMAGRGQRFVDMGFHMPKPLVMVDDKQIIDWAFKSIDLNLYNPIFVVRKDHISQYQIDEILRQKFGEDVQVVVQTGFVPGAVASCMVARDLIDNETPLAIYTLDVYFEPSFDWTNVPNDSDGHIVTFKANNPAYSYALVADDGHVVETAEKEVISENAAAGIYYFRQGHQFVAYAEEMIKYHEPLNGEFYICPLYNQMIKDGHWITTHSVNKMHVMGTPAELEFFQKNVLPKFGDKRVAIVADHSGFRIKERCKEILDAMGIEYIDFGTHTPNDCDYNTYVDQAADFIQRGTCDFGLAFCRTGQGMNMCANKHKGIRSALVLDTFMAEMAVRHNCANFFAMSERTLDNFELRGILRVLADVTFDGGRFMNRIMRMEEIENR